MTDGWSTWSTNLKSRVELEDQPAPVGERDTGEDEASIISASKGADEEPTNVRFHISVSSFLTLMKIY